MDRGRRGVPGALADRQPAAAGAGACLADGAAARRPSRHGAAGGQGRHAERQAGQETGTSLSIPLGDALAAVIAATKPVGLQTFLVDSKGRPFDSKSLGAWFSEACQASGVDKPMHGLRKLACSRLAEAGASVFEVQAVSGHKSLGEVSRYTRAASQTALARSAMAKAKVKP